MAAAIITGTMASPSSPSVKFTALAAPAMVTMPTTTKKRPMGSSRVSRKGTASMPERCGASICMIAQVARAADAEFDRQAGTAGKPVRRSLGDFIVVIQEAEQSKGKRHQQHDPDIAVGEAGPEQRRTDPGDQDQEAAHGGRAGFFDDVTLRPVGADGLALALLFLQPADQDGD